MKCIVIIYYFGIKIELNDAVELSLVCYSIVSALKSLFSKVIFFKTTV